MSDFIGKGVPSFGCKKRERSDTFCFALVFGNSQKQRVCRTAKCSSWTIEPQLVGEIDRSAEFNSSETKTGNFVGDPGSDRQPMKFCKQSVNVFFRGSSKNQPRSTVLNMLQFLDETVWKTSQQRIRVIKSRKHKWQEFWLHHQ